MTELMKPSGHWDGYTPTKDLENFRNNGGSAGLDGVSRVGGKNELEKDGFEAYFEVLRSIAGDEFLEKVYINDVGNPPGFEYRGYWITRSDVQNAFNAWRLSQYLEDGMHITEIGAGFCGLAVMLKRLFPNMTFDIIDLPEQREIQKYYVSQTVGLNGFNWIEPSDARKSDVAINIRSMMEMTWQQVNQYFDIIKNIICPEWFYCVNRYVKRDITIKDYPFGDNWTMLVSSPLMFEPAIHEYLLHAGGYNFTKQLKTLPPYDLEFPERNITVTTPFTMQEYTRIK